MDALAIQEYSEYQDKPFKKSVQKMNKERNRFKNQQAKNMTKHLLTNGLLISAGDSKAKEGVTYKNVFLDDFEKMDKKK